MKKVKMISVITAICLLCGAVAAASGCSRETVNDFTVGVNGAVPVTVTPVILEEQNVTFSVYDFPGERYYEEDAFEVSTVTTEYKMYNSESVSQTVTLALPFYDVPAYYQGSRSDLAEKFSVTVDGVPAELSVRTTYNNGENVLKAVEKIRDGYAEYGVFSYDALVTEYVYRVEEDINYKSRIWIGSLSVGENSAVILPKNLLESDGQFYFIYGEREFSVFVVGPPTDPALFVREEESGREFGCRLTGTNTTTFGEFVMSNYEEGSGMLQRDWFNLIVDMLTVKQKNILNAFEFTMGAQGGRGYRWYLTTVTVPAEGRAVAAVTAPTFPSILTHSSNPNRYEYRYDLTSSSQWAEVRSLRVNVDTCYKLVEDKERNFTAKDGGYTATKQYNGKNRPDGNLTFSLSTTAYVDGRLSSLEWFFIIVLAMRFLPAVIGIIVIIVFTVKKIKRKSKDK